jgi:hypothetical protein
VILSVFEKPPSNYQSKKMKKLGMKDRYICDILVQERFLKIQYSKTCPQRTLYTTETYQQRTLIVGHEVFH